MNAAAASAAAEFATATVERDIVAASLVDFAADEAGSSPVTASRADDITRADGSVRAHFPPGDPVFEVQIALPETLLGASGISVSLQLDGWRSIAYVAVGHSTEGTFRHVKVRHPLQGSRTHVTFGHDDLVYAIQNPSGPRSPADVADVRVYVKGEPEESGATIAVFWAAAWRADPRVPAGLPEAEAQPPVLAILQDYLRARNKYIAEQAQEYLSTGRFPVAGEVVLDWPINQALPTGLEDDVTYRYIWHSLYPAAYLALHGLDTGDLRATQAALAQVASWLERSYYTVDPDPRYTWYDHGTAERVIALLVVVYSTPAELIEPRLRRRLQDTLTAHAELLESEAFYAANQRTRFHNHAWFQDLALLAASALLTSPAASRWAEVAARRLERQVQELVCWDSGYAVFVENSIGYHRGILPLVIAANGVLEAATDGRSLRDVIDGLRRWSSAFRYADGRAPSHGDSYRVPNGRRKALRDVATTSLVLSKAGYGLAHGNADGKAFTLAFLAPSLSETHKHADSLSLTFYYDAVEWLIDPSFHSHAYTDPIPAYLRGPWAHNALAIPDAEYSIAPGTTTLEPGAGHGNARFEAVGSHAAVAGYSVHRSVSAPLDRVRLDVTDEVSADPGTDASATACLVFHLGEGVDVEIDGTDALLRHPTSEECLRLALPAVPRVVTGWHGSASVSSVSGTSFQRYLSTTSLLLDVAIPSSTSWRLTRQADPAA